MSSDSDVRLKTLARQLGSGARRNEILAPYTTFRIGGPADVFVQPATAEELARSVLAARQLGVPYFVLGLGANVLVGDKGFRGLVIRNAAGQHEFRQEGDLCHLWTESGAIVKDLIQQAVAAGWSGLEHFVGIPSTVGGAIWQNLHFLSPAPKRERTVFLAEVFESCEILSVENERKVVGPDYVRFGYDDSVFHHRPDVVLSASFRLSRGDSSTMHRVMQENLSWRGGKHPWLEWHPSVGSVFKKAADIGAGRLIDECGLKGLRVGDAQVSVIHANIIVNLGHASAADVRGLIDRIQRAVRDRFNVWLEPEIAMVGEF